MHFDFTISLGNILTIVALVGLILRIDKVVRKFLIEHEMLINWYCKEHNIELKDIPTRMKGLFR
jgi:hypothetical protein